MRITLTAWKPAHFEPWHIFNTCFERDQVDQLVYIYTPDLGGGTPLGRVSNDATMRHPFNLPKQTLIIKQHRNRFVSAPSKYISMVLDMARSSGRMWHCMQSKAWTRWSAVSKAGRITSIIQACTCNPGRLEGCPEGPTLEGLVNYLHFQPKRFEMSVET